MNIIVPLAGPDLVLKDGTFRPFFPYQGKPMITQIISSRPWFKSGEAKAEDLIFVLREVEKLPELQDYLESSFPGSKQVILKEMTRGALNTALAGVSLVKDFGKPIAVDLVDIDYSAPDFSPSKMFALDPTLFGIIPTFNDSNPKFSYLKMQNNVVLECAEKKVISDVASAGTYFFRNLPTFLHAALGSVKNPERVAFKNSLFLCPSFNFLIDDKLKVINHDVTDVVNLSLLFH
ncbi:hypothetical protein DOM22_09335 [Bdellovibrio sp. ZAP7]|uniref:hypothetical protein n=1 Tax=Bdellovibrio sp. ZAP7 TaxID=2231053 RepID=UPI001156E827|nr:hypothetical protein [Bdellovibrio sp. ZAP7]QDK45341.1 hypothetical protein DOM22_09335 [Bdellovibrio sp. ZAP7]